MDKNLREILFGLFVTLSSVRGGDFTFCREAYLAARDVEPVNIQPVRNLQRIKISNAEFAQEWIEDPHGVIQGQTKIKKLIPLNPDIMVAQIERKKDNEIEFEEPEHLSYMLMSFHVASHRTGTTYGNGEDGESVQTLYGKLVICFKNRENQLQPETCLYAFMFAPPEDEHSTHYSTYNSKILNPLNYEDMKSIREGSSFVWSLSYVKKLFSNLKKVTLRPSQPAGPTTDLIFRLQRGESAFYTKPIIVDEDILVDYYVWVSKV